MRLISWNINSVRLRLPSVLKLTHELSPDIICLQETKVQDAEFPLEAIDANYHGEVAERWRYKDGAGEIGVISSVTQAFCSTCTRIRLSTEGQLYTCLFAQGGHDLRGALRRGAGDEQLRRVIAAVWRERDDRYSEIRTAATALPDAPGKIEMSYIGG